MRKTPRHRRDRRSLRNSGRFYGLPALVLLAMDKLKVVPLSRRTSPPFKLRVEPPEADVLLDCVICKPRKFPVKFPAVFAVALVVAPTVLPAALVVLPATLPTVDVVVFTTPPTVLPTPPGKPPPLPRCPPPALALELLDERVIVCEPNVSSLPPACARASA